MTNGNDPETWREFLRGVHCPKCAGNLNRAQSPGLGALQCAKCSAQYPVLDGIPILLRKPHDYILSHAKGIARFTDAKEIPKAIRREFESIVKEFNRADYMEEDLESARVIALYLATHYLNAREKEAWWREEGPIASPLIEKLMREQWDHGFWREVERLAREFAAASPGAGEFRVAELGCGVGGVARFLDRPGLFYLGLDTSFASLQMARRVYAQPEFKLRMPGDLLRGEFSRELKIKLPPLQGSAFFCVADIENAPLRARHFDGNISLNTIDMLDQPENLPKTQLQSVREGGWVMASSPFIWQPKIAQGLRKKSTAPSSGKLFRELYEKAGMKLKLEKSHLPWLFFKHERQLEIYSVDLLVGQSRSRG